MRVRVALLACALAALACRKGSEPTSKDVEPKAEPSGASVKRAPEAIPALLTVEDFEEEAARQINGENIETELALLEQEVRKN